MSTTTELLAANERYERLRAAVEELAAAWSQERYPDTGDSGWNQGYDIRRESDSDQLRALLDPA